MRKNKHDHKKSDDPIEIRPDLQDASKGRDLSYLSEMPQMGGYEGIKAGAPKDDTKQAKSKDKK